MIRHINQTVWELLIGILLTGVLLEAAGLFLFQDKKAYTAGLLIGLAVAVFMVFHMNASIEKAMDIGEGGAKTQVISGYAVRTLVILTVIVLLALFSKNSLFSLFLGVMTLKVAAYIQPITHKFIEGRKRRR